MPLANAQVCYYTLRLRMSEKPLITELNRIDCNNFHDNTYTMYWNIDIVRLDDVPVWISVAAGVRSKCIQASTEERPADRGIECKIKLNFLGYNQWIGLGLSDSTPFLDGS